MREKIDVFEHAAEILGALTKGVLRTTKAGEKVNSMTISWGALGIEWGKPVFTVYVRENRFTRSQLEKNPEFTISIPVGDFDRRILAVCGTKSGRSADKAAELGLTLEPGAAVSVPAIRELPLTLECRVVYRQAQDPAAVSAENRAAFYPQDVDSSFHGSNRDYHTAYYGEIVAAYRIR
jgi:flavin reductase (DIM6/NTAB) family NADH-FMN oxidoreductase RutF